jgi:outer membrane protein assembly factor BamA
VVWAALYEYNNIFRGADNRFDDTVDRFSPGSLPGLENRVGLLGTTISISHDSRNQIGGPTAGFEMVFGGGLFHQPTEDKYGLYKFHFDIKRYIHLFYGRTLVCRVAGEFVEPHKNRAVPFYHLAELGRRESIRGFPRGRFRDHDMILGSLEYHYPLMVRPSGTFEAVLFVDAGQVADNVFSDFNSGNVMTAIGFSLRYWNPEQEVTNFTFSKSKEQIRLYFTIGM